MKQDYLNLLVFVSCITITTARKCPKSIKYSVQSVTENFTYETEEFENEVISPNKKAYIITLQGNVPIICKGMLNITKSSAHFYAYSREIQEIEVGAFDNQNLRSQLFLSNNALSVIKKGTFTNMYITELDLSYNEITIVEEGAIKDLPNLYTIHLSRNKIVEFHPNSLINTPKMLFFDMLYNKMEKLEEKHFSFMSKERNVGIGISSNELTEIHPRAFEGIDVFSLNISDNRLKSIPKEVFSRNSLHYLYIANNEITHLDKEFFEIDTNILRDVELEGNNFDEETKEKLKPFMEIIMENRRQDQQYHHF